MLGLSVWALAVPAAANEARAATAASSPIVLRITVSRQLTSSFSPSLSMTLFHNAICALTNASNSAGVP